MEKLRKRVRQFKKDIVFDTDKVDLDEPIVRHMLRMYVRYDTATYKPKGSFDDLLSNWRADSDLLELQKDLHHHLCDSGSP